MLWITPKWPLPAQDGARQATCQLLRNLSAQGHAIELLSITGADEVVDADAARRELGVKNVHVLRRAENGTGLVRLARVARALLAQPGVPATLRNYAPRELAERIDEFVKKASVVVYDGLHPAAHRLRNGRYDKLSPGPRVIYRAHNFETDIWKRKAELSRNPLVRAFFLRQAAQVETFERSLAARSDGLAPVSVDDLRVFQQAPELKAVRSRVVPIGYDFRAPDPFPNVNLPIHLLFLGRLDWPPNHEGIIWFLRDVWPKARALRPDLSLDIAGSGNSAPILPWISQPGIRFLGRVESVDEAYRSCHVSLAPIFYGSGTRVKVIEAACHGRACLSTAIGVEGTGLIAGEGYLRAETAADWISALERLTREQAEVAGNIAFESLKQTFDAQTCARDFGQLAANERT